MLSYLETDILAVLLFVLVTMAGIFGMLFLQRPNLLLKGNKIGEKCALRRKCRIAALKCRCYEKINGFVLMLFALSSIMLNVGYWISYFSINVFDSRIKC